MKQHPITILLALAILLLAGSCHGSTDTPSATPVADSMATVYLTHEISSSSLVRIYQALGMEPTGRVAVKISTGESGRSNYLRPELIGDLVHLVNGTIVECNCAYWGNRDNNDEHWEQIRERGFLDIAEVDIMDAEGEIRLPVRDSSHIPYNLVGSHLTNYDFLINLSHFKGHPMAGYGGAIKNQSIGIASANGKLLLHSAGRKADANHKLAGWSAAVAATPQDEFLESMAAAAQSVADYFQDRIVYINVMNNLSVDCDCIANPKEPQMEDVGILASTDPVALDQACLDIVFNTPATEGNDPTPLIRRINKKHGTHTTDYAAKIGLGTQRYRIVEID
ncbi:MAG: DUF362 domain-containing protein [Bacteroidales bacterium]|nr:DUF362 domain-containing protein [Bacteroidales bacterium]